MTDLTLTMVEPCRSCPHKKRVHGVTFGSSLRYFWVCGNQCERATMNGNHPLSPCRIDGGLCEIGEVDEYGNSLPDEAIEYGLAEGYRFCDVDEDAINEGGRCFDYCSWLETMRAYCEKNNFVIPNQITKGWIVDWNKIDQEVGE